MPPMTSPATANPPTSAEPACPAAREPPAAHEVGTQAGRYQQDGNLVGKIEHMRTCTVRSGLVLVLDGVSRGCYSWGRATLPGKSPATSRQSVSVMPLVFASQDLQSLGKEVAGWLYLNKVNEWAFNEVPEASIALHTHDCQSVTPSPKKRRAVDAAWCKYGRRSWQERPTSERSLLILSCRTEHHIF